MLTRQRTRLRLAGIVVVAAALLLALLTALQSPAGPGSATQAPAMAAGRDFLNKYVEPDGRTVRRDQGGDTVSEGQAYALLVAGALNDQAAFARVWSWTQSHLQEPDGLFAYRTNAQGQVVDAMPASDADVLTAWALVRMNGPAAAAYHAEGRRIASAVLMHETVRRGGTLMLAAGPWATGEPITLDPSYWSPAAFAALARATGDPRWRELADSTIRLSSELTSDGRLLPPDWARVNVTAPIDTPAPNREAPSVQYGLDAQRLIVWLASGCDAPGRSLAAGLNAVLSRGDRAGALALSPVGAVLNDDHNAMSLVAAAAAAQAAGDLSRRDQLLAQAGQVDRAHPTYYGTAWLALGRILLTTRLLGGC